MKLDDHFDRIVCLAYDRRQLEYDQSGVIRIQEEITARGGTVQTFLAGKGDGYPRHNYGWIDTNRQPRPQAYNYACCLLAILERAERDNIQRLLFLEDDAQLTPRFDQLFPSVIALAEEVILETPTWSCRGYDLLYLGGNHVNGNIVAVTDYLIKPQYTLDLHAVVFSISGIRKLLDLEASAEHTIDGMIAERQRRGVLNVYAAHPSLVIQRAGYSFNEKRFDDKSDRYWV